MKNRYVKVLNNFLTSPKWIINWAISLIKWNWFQNKVIDAVKNKNDLTRFIWLYWALWWGKTFLWAYLSALFAVTTSNTNILVVREYKKQAIENNMQKIIEFFQANWMVEWKDYKPSFKEWYIKIPLTNSTIYFEWARWWALDSKIRSKEFYFAWLEEATFLSVDNLKVINERVRWTKNKLFWNPFILITNNPDNVSEMKEYLDEMVERWIAIWIKTSQDDNSDNLKEYYNVLDMTMTNVEKKKMLSWDYNETEPYFFSSIKKELEDCYYYTLEKETEWINKYDLIHYIWFDEWITAKNALVHIITDWYNYWVDNIIEFDIDWWYDDMELSIKEFIKWEWLSISEVNIVADPALFVRKRWENWVNTVADILEQYWLNLIRWNNDNTMFINILKTLVRKKRIKFNFYNTKKLIAEINKWKRKFSKIERKYVETPQLKQSEWDDALTAFKYALSIAFNWWITKKDIDNKLKNWYYNMSDFTSNYVEL